jgi:hypothetical protein
MQRHTRSLRKALQTVRDHLSTEITDLLALEAEVDHCPWPAGEVDNCPRECLVEGCVAAAETLEGLARAEGFCKCFADGEECIFCCMVVVD